MKEPGHMEAILERHAKLLWWMTDQARFAFLAELREDYIFEDKLRRVEECMSCPEIIGSPSFSPSQGASQ